MVRSFAAVICGYIVTGILIFATDQTFAATVPGFNDMPMPPRFYFLISICTDTLYSVLGGWTCAAIAKTRVRDRVLALIALGELVGVVSTIALWGTVPHYFSFALLVLYPPAVWIGSLFRKPPSAVLP
jgi:hypothetical protein